MSGKTVKIGGATYVCAWRDNLLLVTDENRQIKFNGVVSGSMPNIQDVEAGIGFIWVFGTITGVTNAQYGFARLNPSTWQIDPPGGVMGR